MDRKVRLNLSDIGMSLFVNCEGDASRNVSLMPGQTVGQIFVLLLLLLIFFPSSIDGSRSGYSWIDWLGLLCYRFPVAWLWVFLSLVECNLSCLLWGWGGGDLIQS